MCFVVLVVAVDIVLVHLLVVALVRAVVSIVGVDMVLVVVVVG